MWGTERDYYNPINHSVASHTSLNQVVLFILKGSYQNILKYTICQILKSHCFVICIVCISVIATYVRNIHIDFRHNVFCMSVKPTCNWNAGDRIFFLWRQVLLHTGTGKVAIQCAVVSSQTSPASPQSSINTIWCLFLKLSSRALDAWDSLFPSLLVTFLFPCLFLWIQAHSVLCSDQALVFFLGPSLTSKTGLLIGCIILRRHLNKIGLTEGFLCRKCRAEEEISAHIL